MSSYFLLNYSYNVLFSFVFLEQNIYFHFVQLGSWET